MIIVLNIHKHCIFPKCYKIFYTFAKYFYEFNLFDQNTTNKNKYFPKDSQLLIYLYFMKYNTKKIKQKNNFYSIQKTLKNHLMCILIKIQKIQYI